MKRDVMKSLVLYIVSRVTDPSKLGNTKLNKILWFSEKEYFLLYDELATEFEYIRMPYGPVPELIEEIKDELQKDGELSIRTAVINGYQMTLYYAVNEANLEST